MKHIYLNLKRFDIPPERGGVNALAPAGEWARTVVSRTQGALERYRDTEFVQFFPELHLLDAVRAVGPESPVRIGCQGVHREDTAPGGNFGAFTTCRTANSMAAAGVSAALLGHCEERREKAGVLAEAGCADPEAVDRLLCREVLAAQSAGLDVLYCIGESGEEQPRWKEVLGRQLDLGLAGADRKRVVIAYEPVWSIGPGKTPAGRDYIQMIARFIKEHTGGADVVYGGGLKADNAGMLSSIPEIDGGLIALTRFTGEIGFYPEEYLEIVERYLTGDGV